MHISVGLLAFQRLIIDKRADLGAAPQSGEARFVLGKERLLY